MTRNLFAATALATGTLTFLAAPVAAEAPELTISGESDWAYVVQDVDGPGNADGTDGDLLQAGDGATALYFEAEGTADNGLTYGAKIDWRTASDGIDEHYIYFEGGWGRMHLGADDGAVANTVVGGADVLGGDALYDGEHQVIAANGRAAIAVDPTADTGDTNKFTYYSPSFGGFSVAASYVPDTASTGLTAGVANGPAGNAGQFEAAALYEGSLGAADVAFGAGYMVGEGGDTNEDNEGFEIGATVSFGGFSLGAGYGDNFDTGLAQNSNADGGEFWNLGAGYSFGAASVYAGYAAAQADDAAGNEDEADYFGLGADYALAEGLVAYAEYGHSTADDASANTEQEADYVLLGTTISY